MIDRPGRLTRGTEFRYVYDDHLLTVAVKEDHPIQLRVQPVGVARIDGIDLTPPQARMLAAVLSQAADINEKGVTL